MQINCSTPEGGLLKARWFFDDDQPFFVAAADVITNLDLIQLYQYHLGTQAAGHVGGKTTPLPPGNSSLMINIIYAAGLTMLQGEIRWSDHGDALSSDRFQHHSCD